MTASNTLTNPGLQKENRRREKEGGGREKRWRGKGKEKKEQRKTAVGQKIKGGLGVFYSFYI